MADVFDRETRSRIMSRIRGKNTKPEVAINLFLARNKIGSYKRNYAGLPGSPDFFFPGKRIVVFYNSSFWHCRNPLKVLRMKPYWRRKLWKNFVRDIKTNLKLMALGYRIVTIWGEEYKSSRTLRKKLAGIL